MNIYCLIVALALPLCLAHTNFLLCPKGRAGRLIHLPRKVECPVVEESNEKSIREHVQIWIPTHPLESVVAWKCHILHHRICTYEGFFGSGGEVDNVQHLEAVSPQECHQVVSTMHWKEVPLVPVQRQTWSTNKTVRADYTWCCKTHCYEGSNFILEKGLVSTLDERTAVSTLGDLTGCQFRRGWCPLSDSIIVWTPEEAIIPCPFQRKGEFVAEFRKDVILIDSINGAFTPAPTPPIFNLTCLPQSGVHTAQGPYIEIPPSLAKKYRHITSSNATPSPSTKSPFPAAHAPKLHSLNLDPEDAKFEWLFEEFKDDSTRSHNAIRKVVCQVMQRQLDLMHELLVLDPTLGVRALLGNDTFVAKWVGLNVLLVTACEEVVAEEIITDHKVGEQCYEFTPIRANGKLYFVVPGTRELVLQSPRALCDLIHPTVYLDKLRGWVTSKGPAQVTTIPLQAAWSLSWHLPIFDSAPLFHTKEEDTTHEHLAVLRAYADETSRLRAQMDRMIEYTSGLSVDPQGMLNELNKAGEGISSKFTSSLGGLIGGPLQAFVNTLVTIGFIVGIVYIAYRIAACYFCRGGGTGESGRGNGGMVSYIPVGNQFVRAPA